jgi:uncharacterized protein YxjI
MNVRTMNFSTGAGPVTPKEEFQQPSTTTTTTTNDAAAASTDDTTTTTTTTASSTTAAAAAAAETDANNNTEQHPSSHTTNSSKFNFSPQDEQDEEIRLAMEMAMAAAQNTHLKPDDIRKLVGQKNRQCSIVSEVQQGKLKKIEHEQQLKKQQATKRWENQKQSARNWWSQKAAAVTVKAEELVFEAEKQYYAEDIRADPDIIAIRKRMKRCKKTIKLHRLQGNRVETRHTFKRRRMEKNLLELERKLKRATNQLLHTSYNVHEYAKAMMRASRKWHKKGSKEELALEAQLCRNMHQMLTIEKLRGQSKKSAREIKKYLQRCKSWLSDKKAFCEMHIITLDATSNSMRLQYEDILQHQDEWIRTLLARDDEFANVDLASVALPHFNYSIEHAPGPKAMLNALRGLPIRDSVRMTKEQVMCLGIEDEDGGDGNVPPPQMRPGAAGRTGPEIYIDANADDVSVSSHLSDPDGDFDHEQQDQEEGALPDNNEGSDSEDGGFDFGNDAPWNQKPNNSGSDLNNTTDTTTTMPALSSDTSPKTLMGAISPPPAAAAAAPLKDSAERDEKAETEKKNSTIISPVAKNKTAAIKENDSVSIAESTLDGGDILMVAALPAKAVVMEYSVDTMNYYVSEASDDEDHEVLAQDDDDDDENENDSVDNGEHKDDDDDDEEK